MFAEKPYMIAAYILCQLNCFDGERNNIQKENNLVNQFSAVMENIEASIKNTERNIWVVHFTLHRQQKLYPYEFRIGQ